MAAYIRPLSVSDLDRCCVVESAAFPPAEAATRQKIEYRLSVCSGLCFGLFVPEGTPDSDVPRSTERITILANASDGEVNDRLIAHVIATKSTSRVVRDEDMAVPPKWKESPTTQFEVGHSAQGRNIALHSLAVSPAHQRSGFGKKLLSSYIEHMRQAGGIDRISILTYDRLVPYYQKLGFTHYGKSASEYAGIAWHDLAYEFSV